MAAPKFFIDEDAQQDLARTLGALGIDAVATREAGTKGWGDARQLHFATAQRRIIVTCNAGDFALLHEALTLWARREGSRDPSHAGILVVPNGSRISLADLTRLVAAFANEHDAEDLAGRCFAWSGAAGWRERHTS